MLNKKDMTLDDVKKEIEAMGWDYEHLPPRWEAIPDAHGVMVRHKRLVVSRLFKRHTEIEAAQAALKWVKEMGE